MGGDEKRPLRVLSEEVRKRGESSGDENPYWQEEETPPPSEAEGCIRRGACCRTSPGWFGPGEVEAAAQHLALTPDEFARRYLVIDGIELDEHGRVEVFAPLKLDRQGKPSLPPLSRADDWYRVLKGVCIFYDANAKGCRIYAARPIECRHYFCGHDPQKNLSHEAIARSWIAGEPAE